MKYVIAPANDDLMHSRGPWKKHKYTSKIGNKYIYGKNTTIGRLKKLNKKYKMDKEVIERNKEDVRTHSIANAQRMDDKWGMHLSKKRQTAKHIKWEAKANEKAERYADKQYDKLNKKTRKKAINIVKNSKLGKKIISKLKRKK